MYDAYALVFGFVLFVFRSTTANRETQGCFNRMMSRSCATLVILTVYAICFIYLLYFIIQFLAMPSNIITLEQQFPQFSFALFFPIFLIYISMYSK